MEEVPYVMCNMRLEQTICILHVWSKEFVVTCLEKMVDSQHLQSPMGSTVLHVSGLPYALLF